MTTYELESLIRTRLDEKDIIRDAQVSIVIEDRPSFVFSVLTRPLPPSNESDEHPMRSGMFDFPKPHLRLLEALAISGGIEPGVERIRILRRLSNGEGDGGEVKRRVIEVAVEPLLADGTGDLEIEPGDVIVIPPPPPPAPTAQLSRPAG